MRDVAIIGVGMTRFGRFPDRGIKDLGAEAFAAALKDAGVEPSRIQAAYVGNAIAGLISGQECIRGQVILRSAGLGGIPVFNVENACASGSSALHLAWIGVASGMYEMALVLGVEKLSQPDKGRTFAAMGSAIDVEASDALRRELGVGADRTVYMDLYAREARTHMARYGTSRRQLAMVASKNSDHGSLNPYAQFRQRRSVDDVLGDRLVVDPLTRSMCSPIGDGAAAILLGSSAVARRLSVHRIWIRASVIRSGSNALEGDAGVVGRAAQAAYEMAGIGPDDVDVAEVHDATAYCELDAYEQLGFCAIGEGGRFVETGHSSLGGRLPVNPSGGLLARGHPVGATGVAQVIELTYQLRGQAENRQVSGAQVGLAQNAGGYLGSEEAAAAVHIIAS